MNVEAKLFLFYLSLSETEKATFENLIGFDKFNKIRSRAEPESIQAFASLRPYPNEEKKISTSDYDAAILQLVRHIVDKSDSNLDLIEIIKNTFGKEISRPEKRSKYELKGILLEVLLSASKEKLAQIREQLLMRRSRSRQPSKDQTNLDKWFSIILESSK